MASSLEVNMVKLCLFSCVLCGLFVPMAHELIVKRSDDPSPLEAVIQQLVSDVSSLKSQLSAKDAELLALRNDLQLLKDRDNQGVAFTAYISETMIPDSSKGVIRFSHTLTNVGNAYNSNSGAFTAPYDGDYMFIVRVDTSPDYDALMIAKNGHAVVSGHNDGRNDYHIVTCCVMTLTSGDTVTVNHSVGEVKGHVDGGSESLFVGFRIR